MFNSFFYFIVKNLFRIIFTVYNRLEVFGRENITSLSSRSYNGPVIVASNHCSNIDPPLLGASYPTRLRYLAKDSLFKNPILGFFIRTLGAIPVTREDSQKAGAVLKLLIERLEAGDNIVLFPEGSRSPDGKLQPLEAGVAFLSVKSGAPIVPAYIHGSYHVCARGSSSIKPAKLKVYFGPPIFPPRDMKDREARGAIMRVLESELSRMKGDAGDV